MLWNLHQFTDYSLLCLRIIVAIVFLVSGWGHVSNPQKSGKELGKPPLFATFLGIWEILGALSVLLGIYPQIGALMLISIMLGAIYTRIFVWKQGFFENHTDGWHYDLLFVCANLVILTTAGGRLILYPS